MITETLAWYADNIPLILTLAAIVIVAVEWLVLARLRRIEQHREGWVNIFCGAASFFPVFLLNIIIIMTVMFAFYEMRLFDLGLDWYVWILAYIAYDFMSFIVHLASHKVRLLWCMHSVHHSPKEMKASVSFRGSFADFLVTPHTTLWLPLLGFHPFMVILMEGVGLLYGIFLHFSDKWMPEYEPRWLRWFFITPSIHRLHHGNNDSYLDTNYGLMFTLWDRVFNTYQPRIPEVYPTYGLTKELDSANFRISQTDEFISLWRDVQNAPRWLDKLSYLFKPPGWSQHVL
ncbi:sterol desaturase family protein [Candidatus Albibeggiatoa sp. nov. NOAA]|uniref:sterol desaturase family protein n=1 Tax=Candidatus Albibeggiatoa sp. nov. NOAA TaxID=3162724 RepID=UPI0032FE50DF|nr:sterol desaturase family protein [Thiotrichaceae bacterium]